jgi:formylglycine-generating enzyme required for sulfatase activity
MKAINTLSPLKARCLRAAPLLLLWACGGADKPGGPAGPTELPVMVELSAGAVQSGFAVGRLRKQVELDGYRISEHPTTRAQYASCVEAGACPQADGSECLGGTNAGLGPYTLERQDAPAVCVGHAGAAAYCEWLGGELPSLSQWLYAARGAQPQRYAWGQTAPSCSQHPLSQHAAVAGEPGSRRSSYPCAGEQERAELRVLQHAEGASAQGLQDVLLTPGELLSSEEGAQFSACGSGFAACVVYGMDAGAIDAVAPLRPLSGLSMAGSRAGSRAGSSEAPAQGLTVAHAYSFRCVLEEE